MSILCPIWTQIFFLVSILIAVTVTAATLTPNEGVGQVATGGLAPLLPFEPFVDLDCCFSPIWCSTLFDCLIM